MAKKGTRTKAKAAPAPPPLKEKVERCANCGRENTLVTRVSCTECGATKPA